VNSMIFPKYRKNFYSFIPDKERTDNAEYELMDLNKKNSLICRLFQKIDFNFKKNVFIEAYLN